MQKNKYALNRRQFKSVLHKISSRMIYFVRYIISTCDFPPLRIYSLANVDLWEMPTANMDWRELQPWDIWMHSKKLNLICISWYFWMHSKKLNLICI